MSAVLAGRVWESGLHHSLKPLTAAIADIANRDGENVFPSIEYLAWMTGKGVRTVQEQMKQLRAKRILVATCHEECQESPGAHHGHGQPVCYRLDIERLPKRESWESFRSRRRTSKRVATKGADSAPIADARRVQFPTPKGAVSDKEGCGTDHPIRDLDPGEDPISLLSLGSVRKWLPVLHRKVEDAAHEGTLPPATWGAREIARIHELAGDRGVEEDIEIVVRSLQGETAATPARPVAYGLGTLRNRLRLRESSEQRRHQLANPNGRESEVEA